MGLRASPILIGDKLLIISLGGEATVLKASDDFKVLGEMDLGGPVGASPHLRVDVCYFGLETNCVAWEANPSSLSLRLNERTFSESFLPQQSLFPLAWPHSFTGLCRLANQLKSPTVMV